MQFADFWEMKIRELQNREFQGRLYMALDVMSPKIALIPFYNAKWQLFDCLILLKK